MNGDNKIYWTWIKNQRLADIALEEARGKDDNLIKSLKQQLEEAEAKIKDAQQAADNEFEDIFRDESFNLGSLDEEAVKRRARKLSPSSKQRKQLEKEKRALERKHNIVQNVLLGGAGVSAAASMFTEDEEASGSSLAMAGLLGFFGIKKGKKVTEALAKGTKKGQAKNASDEAIRAKGGTPTPDPEPIGRAAVEAEKRC